MKRVDMYCLLRLTGIALATVALLGCGRIASPQANHPATGAAIGDGVCAQSWSDYHTDIQPTTAAPIHTKAQAFVAAKAGAAQFANQGVVDGYFASVTTTSSGTNLMWVIEFNGLNDKMAVGPAGRAQEATWHHLVFFIRDSDLSPLEAQFCP